MFRLIGTATLAGLISGFVALSVTGAGAEPRRDHRPATWTLYSGPHGELLGAELPAEARPRAPSSDQIRGPVHDSRTGIVRPGNPSPSVR
ncbi:hypothetical protein U8607_08280 [Methylobacterium durans]|uniref:Uncharacterized protein n=1 Tax=Methylobacterium durans TaxID=2202825 RepID=A0A2U8W5J9_9HYPH|nr:hypothetical protein [Methylobacterium durans]AWN41383.1 hypothetical protein DK389_13750 [Methylobacterium durans]MEA1832078.1 hypothetical protein [Methylobacterium durans]